MHTCAVCTHVCAYGESGGRGENILSSHVTATPINPERNPELTSMITQEFRPRGPHLMILAGPLFFLSLLEVKNGELGEDVLTAGKWGADGKASPGCVTDPRGYIWPVPLTVL